MHTIRSPLLLFVFCAAAAFAALVQNANTAAAHTVIGALYFMDNNLEANAVITSDIFDDGTIKVVNKFYTGGQGSSGINGNVSGGPDALFSQGAVTTTGDKFLFAVNPGSNSLSMFHINPAKPTTIKLLGQPAPSGGEFPVSVAFNPKHNLACVLNGGAKNGIRCFKASKTGLVAIAGSDRDLGLVNQTTPPVGPANTVSHILFDAKGDNLLVSVKGTPPSGYVASFSVGGNGALAAVPIKSVPSGGLFLPFGMVLIPGSSSVLVTDPNVGVTVYNFKAGGAVPATTISTKIAGQLATCWAAHSPKSDGYFVTDIAASTLVELAVNAEATSAWVVKTVATFNSSTGLIDLAVAHPKRGPDFLFVNGAGSQSIQIFRIEGKGNVPQLANFDLKPETQAIGVTLTKATVGMAVVLLV